MFENYNTVAFHTDNVQYKCWCGNPMSNSGTMCTVCFARREEEQRSFKESLEREEKQVMFELNTWNGFYSRLMAECRELGFKPWAATHPATWAAAQYHEWKSARIREDEGIHDEIEADQIPSWLVAVDLEALVEDGTLKEVGGISEDVEHVSPNRRMDIDIWQRPGLEEKFSVPPYKQATVTGRTRHGWVDGWQVAA